MYSNARPPIPKWLTYTVLVAASFFAGAKLSSRSSTIETRTEELQTALARVETELCNLQQKVSPETEQKLKDLESLLNDRQRWPQDAEAAERMRQELADIVQSLSPIAAERILAQLSRLNWGVEVLWNLRTHTGTVLNEPEQIQSILADLLETQPREVFTEIATEAEARLKEIELQVRANQVKQLLERANLALNKKEDPIALVHALEELQDEEEVAAILPKLQAMILETVSLERIDSLATKLGRTRTLDDDRIRQVSLLTIQDALLRLAVDLEFENAMSGSVQARVKELLAQCDTQLRVLAKKQQDDNANKSHRYQEWAIKQIRAFDSPRGWYYEAILPWFRSELNSFRDASEDKEWLAFQTFPSLKEVVQEKIGVDLSPVRGAMLPAELRKKIYVAAAQTIGWKNSVDEELAYRTTRDGMVKFLLPIEPQLLDPPVAQLYQQAFSKGWQRLEGREDQLFVAQQAAVARKKTLDDVAMTVQ